MMDLCLAWGCYPIDQQHYGAVSVVLRIIHIARTASLRSQPGFRHAQQSARFILRPAAQPSTSHMLALLLRYCTQTRLAREAARMDALQGSLLAEREDLRVQVRGLTCYVSLCALLRSWGFVTHALIGIQVAEMWGTSPLA